MFAHQLSFVAAALALVGMVNGHGMVVDPKPRQPGAAFQANCGDQDFNQLLSDPYGNQQGLQQNQANFAPTPECKLYQCKGLMFEDNVGLVQNYPAGTVVPMTIEIRAPHTGVANVSIISTVDNSIIAGSLMSLDPAYTNDKPMDQQDGLKFDITIPDLGGKCATAGDCAIQWWWDARSIDQTYMSCVDFTQGGSGTPAPSSSAAPVSSAVPTTSVTAPETTSTAAPEPTSTAAETTAVPEPTTPVSEPEPTTSVSQPEPSTTSAEEPAPTTSTSTPELTTAAPEPEPTTSTLSAPLSSFTSVRPVPGTTSAAPAPVTTSTAASAPAPTGVQDANACWRSYNKCLDASQPSPDFLGCGATRDTCLVSARYVRLARSGTIGRRML